MKLHRLCAAGALLSLAFTSAQAQDPDTRRITPEPQTTVPEDHELHPNQHNPLLHDEDGHEDFSDADTDKDSVLSLTEARAALPHFNVKDVDTDGFISQAEAEAALPELKFRERGREGGNAPVMEAEFGMIVIALNERDAQQQISTPE